CPPAARARPGRVPSLCSCLPPGQSSPWPPWRTVVTVFLPVTGFVVVIVVTPDALVVATEWDTGGADWPAAVPAAVPVTPDPLVVATGREAVGARWLAAAPALATRLCGVPAPAAGVAG